MTCTEAMTKYGHHWHQNERGSRRNCVLSPRYVFFLYYLLFTGITARCHVQKGTMTMNDHLHHKLTHQHTLPSPFHYCHLRLPHRQDSSGCSATSPIPAATARQWVSCHHVGFFPYFLHYCILLTKLLYYF